MNDLIVVTSHITFSDWLFLYYLAKNMEPYLFCHLLRDLANELRVHYRNEHEQMLTDEANDQLYRANKLREAEPESIDVVDFRKK